MRKIWGHTFIGPHYIWSQHCNNNEITGTNTQTKTIQQPTHVSCFYSVWTLYKVHSLHCKIIKYEMSAALITEY